MANRIVDLAAAQLYSEDAPRGYVPLAVEGRSASVLVYGDQGHPKELRDFVMKEMKNNDEFYTACLCVCLLGCLLVSLLVSLLVYLLVCLLDCLCVCLLVRLLVCLLVCVLVCLLVC